MPLTLSQAAPTPAPLGNLSEVLDVPAPAPLPAPPAWERLLLESPWMLVAVVGGVGLVLLFFFQHRAQTRAALVSAGVALLVAGSLAALAQLVTTPREAVRAVTTDLIGGVATGNAGAVRGAMTPDGKLYFFLAPQGMEVDEILRTVEGYFATGGSYSVSDWSIEEFQATTPTPTTAQVQVKVRVTPEQWNFPNRSWWRLDLTQDASTKQWRVRAIQPIAIQGVSNPTGTSR